MLSLQFILFTLTGSVILKHWFKIVVAHQATPWEKCVGYKQAGPGAHKEMWFFLNIFSQHFCSISCELVPSFSMMLKEALYVHGEKHTGWGRHCRRLAAMAHQVSLLLSPLFSKVIHCSKKPIISVSLQELQFRSWTNLVSGATIQELD